VAANHLYKLFLVQLAGDEVDDARAERGSVEEGEFPAVEEQEIFGRGEGGALVALAEGMVAGDTQQAATASVARSFSP